MNGNEISRKHTKIAYHIKAFSVCLPFSISLLLLLISKISNETFGQPKVETKNNNNNFFIESLKINCMYYVIEIV